MHEPNTRNRICQERTDMYWEGREKIETVGRFWDHGVSHRSAGICAERRAKELKQQASDLQRKVNS